MKNYFKAFIIIFSVLSIGLAQSEFDVKEKSHLKKLSKKLKKRDAYSGTYVGAGICRDLSKHRAILDDNLQTAYPDESNADGMNFGKKDFSRIGISAIIGHGGFLSRESYLGGEIGIDLMSKKGCTKSFGVRNKSTLKTNGFSPSLSLRLGQYISQENFLIYEKAGLKVQNGKFSSELTGNTEISNRKLTPLIGIGIEKNLESDVNARFEFDYYFQASKSKSNLTGYLENGEVIENYQAKVSHKMRGYTFRLLLIYNLGDLSVVR